MQPKYNFPNQNCTNSKSNFFPKVKLVIHHFPVWHNHTAQSPAHICPITRPSVKYLVWLGNFIALVCRSFRFARSTTRWCVCVCKRRRLFASDRLTSSHQAAKLNFRIAEFAKNGSPIATRPATRRIPGYCARIPERWVPRNRPWIDQRTLSERPLRLLPAFRQVFRCPCRFCFPWI